MRPTALVLSSLLAACSLQTSQPVGVTPPPQSAAAIPVATAQPAGITPIVDEAGVTYQISQGVQGDPAVVGCADGQREAFVDAALFPTIAGCLGEWTGATNLRTPATGQACGDDLGNCVAAANVCAAGWQICGAQGAIADLRRVSPQQCETAGGGRFVAALSHCETQSGCSYDTRPDGDYQCFESGWCSEPVCCGNDCGDFGVCRDGVWPGQTHIPVGTDQGCGAIGSSRARGVMCCKI